MITNRAAHRCSSLNPWLNASEDRNIPGHPDAPGQYNDDIHEEDQI
jgi:hypothetical protein